MSAEVPEFQLRKESKLTLSKIKEGNLEEARRLIRNNKNILSYNFGLPNFQSIIPTVRFSKTIPKNLYALRMLIDTGFEIYSEDNVDELAFFAAAKCDPEKLSYCLDKLSGASSNINRTREGDGIMMFLLKYANPMEKNYEECIRILIKAGVDLNQRDYHARTPASFLVNLYTISMRKGHSNIANLLKTYLSVLMETDKIETAPLEAETNNISKDLIEQCLSNHSNQGMNTEMEDASKWFKFLVEKNENGFIGCKEIINFDLDDGNNTFLQLACEMKLPNVVKYLISKGADLSKVTEWNDKSPIEIAARRNSYDIFRSLLDANKIHVDKKLFLSFLQNRGRQMKTKYFDDILKYNHLDVNIQSSNGNTPLHYAAIFCSSVAVRALLKRKAPLTIRNDSKKCPLEYMDPEDLEYFLNDCIMPEKHVNVNHGKYEIGMDLTNFINSEKSEVDILTIISNSDKLRHLLNHPLLSNFINIKWQLAYPCFELLFSMHLLLYFVFFLSFSSANFFGIFRWLSVILFSIKSFLFFDWHQNKFQTINDVAASIMMFGIFLNGNARMLGVAITLPLAMSFHLFWRYNPNFSRYHARLVNYMNKITVLRSYVFTLLSIFLAGLYLNSVDSIMDLYYIFRNASSAIIFAAFIMFFFTMSLVVISFALDATSEENYDNSFTALGYRYVLYFISYVETFYSKWGLVKSPFVFAQANDKRKYVLKFAINKNKFLKEQNISQVKLSSTRIAELRKILETKF